MHLLNSLGSILARCYFRGARMPHHATNNIRILPGTHLYTWVESSNVDKVSCWRTKSARHWRESNSQPLIQSQGFNPIYQGTSISKGQVSCAFWTGIWDLDLKQILTDWRQFDVTHISHKPQPATTWNSQSQSKQCIQQGKSFQLICWMQFYLKDIDYHCGGSI